MNVSASEPGAARPVWWASGGDGSRRGLFQGRAEVKLTVRHRLPAAGSLQASAVFDADGGVYVADMAGYLQAFDGEGRQRWQARLAGGVVATPVVHASSNRLYVGTLNGWVQALDTAAGKEAWRKHLHTSSDPRILSDLLYVPTTKVVVTSSWGGRFCALDAATGEERDSWDAGISPQAGAAADGAGAVYVVRAVRGQGVQLVRRHDGIEQVLHVQPEKSRGAGRALVAAAPVLDEARGAVFFAANTEGRSVLHAYGLSKGALVWSHPFPAGISATPALRQDGTVLVADLGGTVTALGPDGTPLFRYVTGCEYLLAGPVSDLSGGCFIGDPTGVCHRITAGGLGEVLFEAPRSFQARPSFDALGQFHVPCTDRQVYVFGTA